MNRDIRHSEIRLIGAKGEKHGIVKIEEALRLSEEANLDLVEISPTAVPPVCKIVDFGKLKYEQQKREKLQKKKQHVTIQKEIRLHPNTDTHDFDFKARHAEKFLKDGNKVKVAVLFKGRELAYKDHGKELLIRFIERLDEVSNVEHEIKFEGRTMHAILAPLKVKLKKNNK